MTNRASRQPGNTSVLSVSSSWGFNVPPIVSQVKYYRRRFDNVPIRVSNTVLRRSAEHTANMNGPNVRPGFLKDLADDGLGGFFAGIDRTRRQIPNTILVRCSRTAPLTITNDRCHAGDQQQIIADFFSEVLYVLRDRHYFKREVRYCLQLVDVDAFLFPGIAIA